jgi:uncharacterized integral membrane protein
MKRTVTLSFVLAVLLFGLLLGWRNSGIVTINYFFGTSQAPLSFLIVLMLITGAFCGVLASIGHILKLRREISRLRRNQRQAEQDYDTRRALSYKD